MVQFFTDVVGNADIVGLILQKSLKMGHKIAEETQEAPTRLEADYKTALLLSHNQLPAFKRNGISFTFFCFPNGNVSELK